MKLTVTILDTTGIQHYIFSSNRLRENIGASYLLSQATDAWVKDILNEMGVSNPKATINSSGQNAELVYAGGGNTVLLFKCPKFAIEFTQKLSLKILKEAPGINLVVAHREIEWDKDLLYKTIQDMMANDLDKKKRSRIPSSPLLGLGVTRSCDSTQLVAIDTSQSHHSPADYPISREIVAKLDAVQSANKHLEKTIFDPEKPNKWKIPLDFDNFGRSRGESSYLAIVHIDGNSMGNRFQEQGKDKSDRDYITAMRELSESVHKAGENALKQIIQDLMTSWDFLKEQFDLPDRQLLPFRPLVYGGDDVTFVCDGRLGLTLAARYLQVFEKQKVADNKQLTACAGVCIVKAHYPFARAYIMSEELCKSAKKVAKFKRVTNDERDESEIVSAIDWHIATSGLLGSISEIREREYRSTSSQPLEMRPLLLKSDPSDWQTWESFSHIINEFTKDEWKNRRNKVKALREVLRRGSNVTKEFLTAYRLDKLPEFPESVSDNTRIDLAEQGWLNGICGYFDAIEAIDFYLPLGGN